jgi:signal transduction histidine kinase
MNATTNKDTWKSEFLTRISHEMRTPLTTIIGYSEAGKRLSEFLDSYLDSEVVQRNKKLGEKRQEDLSLLAQRAMERVTPSATTKNVSITARCEAAIYVEEADPERVVQILENLLSNAIDLAPTGGHIEIVGSERPRVIEIDVVNKSQGFLSISALSVRKKFRWIQSPGIEIHHDGLGLAFAEHVVELEGGLLNVQSLEHGITFTVQFPRTCRN